MLLLVYYVNEKTFVVEINLSTILLEILQIIKELSLLFYMHVMSTERFHSFCSIDTFRQCYLQKELSNVPYLIELYPQRRLIFSLYF